MRLTSFFLVFWAFAFIGCNRNALSSLEAKKQIIKYYENNPNELHGTNAFEAIIRGTDSGYNKILFRQYIGAGLLELKETKIDKANTPIHIYQISESNTPFLIKETQSEERYPILVVKMFDYYLDQITDIKYSPDKKEAGAKFTLSIRNLTPFGKDAVNPNHKMFLIGFFKLINDSWKFERIEPDPDKQ